MSIHGSLEILSGDFNSTVGERHDFVVNENIPLHLLDFLHDDYVNCTKTQVMIFRKRGMIRHHIRFPYKGEAIEIVTKFTYLGILFIVGGFFNVTFVRLSD